MEAFYPNIKCSHRVEAQKGDCRTIQQKIALFKGTFSLSIHFLPKKHQNYAKWFPAALVVSGRPRKGTYVNKRQQRQEAIRGLVAQQKVYTQQEMTQLLHDAGFDCTQATVSRDIVELKLEKASGKFYILPEEVRLRRVVPEVVIEVRAAGNLVVVKTRPGGAGSAAEALDKAQLAGIIGSVAGDDTILLVAETPEQAVMVQDFIGGLRA